ncbi:MAG: SIMPL domain-containing protein [Marinibacterium sp.]
MRPFTFGLLALVAALAATLVSAQETARTITVTGVGSVSAAPDMATVSIGVTQHAPEAREAMAATSQKVTAILAGLKASGIDPADIQTQRLSITPIWSNRRNSNGEPPKISGFQASNTVSVRVLDLPALGSVLDKVLIEGANDFGGIGFGLQDPGPVTDAARRAAVADAMARATLYADAAGVELGDVLRIDEQGGRRPQPMMMEAAAARDVGVPIASGEVDVSATVTMVFAIDD